MELLKSIVCWYSRTRGGSDPIHKRGQLIPGIGIQALTTIPNSDPSKISKKGEIGNLPPGKYLLAIPSDAWDWYTIVDDPHSHGYTYHYDPNRRLPLPNPRKIGMSIISKYTNL